jgi:hypothetical protein
MDEWDQRTDIKYPTQTFEKTVRGVYITKRDEINGRGCGTEIQGSCTDAQYE